MTNYTQTSTCAYAPSRTPARRSVIATVLSMFRLRKSRADLRGLDPHLLRDIGLTEDDAKREADRPVWDVPSNWRL